MTQIDSNWSWDAPAEEVTAQHTASLKSLAQAAVEPLWPYLSAASTRIEFEHRMGMVEDGIADRVLAATGSNSAQQEARALLMARWNEHEADITANRLHTASLGHTLAGDGQTAQVMAFPMCDICKAKKAAYDGKTTMGPWAYMCEDDFKTYGVGLGLGQGQKLVLAPSSKTSGLKDLDDGALEAEYRRVMEQQNNTRTPEAQDALKDWRKQVEQERDERSKKRTSAKSDTCPRCGSHMSDVTVQGNTLTAKCGNCGWKGSKTRKASAKTAASHYIEYNEHGGVTHSIPADEFEHMVKNPQNGWKAEKQDDGTYWATGPEGTGHRYVPWSKSSARTATAEDYDPHSDHAFFPHHRRDETEMTCRTCGQPLDQQRDLSVAGYHWVHRGDTNTGPGGYAQPTYTSDHEPLPAYHNDGIERGQDWERFMTSSRTADAKPWTPAGGNDSDPNYFMQNEFGGKDGTTTVDGITVHTFASTGQAYNESQVSDDIKDGDILSVPSEGVVGVMISAWPTAVTPNRGDFEGLNPTYDISLLDGGKYVHAIEVAKGLAAKTSSLHEAAEGYAVCPTCKGAGTHPWDAHKKCPKCKGTGYVKPTKKKNREPDLEHLFGSLHTAEQNPPYYIEEKDGKFVVVNDEGHVKGTFDTREQARQQQKALYANVPGASEEAERQHGNPKPKVQSSVTAAQRCPQCGQYDAVWMPTGKKDEDGEDINHLYCRNCDYGIDHVGAVQALLISEGYGQHTPDDEDEARKQEQEDYDDEWRSQPGAVQSSRQAGVLDRSVIFTALLDVMPSFGQMTMREGSEVVSRCLADWDKAAAAGATDMYAFCKDWAAKEEATHGPRNTPMASRKTAGDLASMIMGLPVGKSQMMVGGVNFVIYKDLQDAEGDMGGYTGDKRGQLECFYDPDGTGGPVGLKDVKRVEISPHGGPYGNDMAPRWAAEQVAGAMIDAARRYAPEPPPWEKQSAVQALLAEAVNDAAEGAERYQHTDPPGVPPWTTHWDDEVMFATDQMTEEGMNAYVKPNPFPNLTTLRDVRTAALKMAGDDGFSEVGETPESELNAATGEGSGSSQQAYTTKPAQVPEGNRPNLVTVDEQIIPPTMPGLDMAQPPADVSDQMGSGGGFDMGYGDPTMPTTEQLVAAKTARLAARILLDNPTMAAGDAKRLAALTIAKHPEMIRVKGADQQR